MDSEKRKAYTILFILGSIIFIFVAIFVWGAYLNKGKVNIIGETPFAVLTADGKQTICMESPCTMEFRRGLVDFVIKKEGYKSISTEAVVKLWQTVDLNIEFQINPYVQKTDSFPLLEKDITYALTLEEGNKMYKLVESTDNQQRPIVYFPKQIKNPVIFGSAKGALIIDSQTQEAYKIDILSKERTKIENNDFTTAEGGVWSDDGKNFAFTKSDSDFIWVLNSKNNVIKLALRKLYTKFAWGHSGDLIFVTQQLSLSNSKVGNYQNYVNILDEVSSNFFSFGQYHPSEDSYSSMGIDQPFEVLPEVLVPADNGKIIYFQLGEEKYRLIL